jgi:hypothetical protein
MSALLLLLSHIVSSYAKKTELREGEYGSVGVEEG